MLNPRVTAATPTAVARDVAFLSLSSKDSGLPIVDSEMKVIGIVTEFDLLRVVRDGRALGTVKVEEIMTNPVTCTREDEDVAIVIDSMTKKNIIRLPVVGKDGEMVGIIWSCLFLLSSGVSRSSD